MTQFLRKLHALWKKCVFPLFQNLPALLCIDNIETMFHNITLEIDVKSHREGEYCHIFCLNKR